MRGFVDAFDANTGQRAWRFYTVPGDPKKPFENDAMRKAAATWSGEWYKMGGGATVWDGMAYDPQANLVYFGTGNGGPWPEVLRGSQGKDNLYVCSIIAVNPDNGEMKWYYQAVPGDSWDYDAVAQLTLADITIAGRPRRVIMQANKNGYFYVIDRITGEFISASPFAPHELVRGDGQEDGPSVHPPARVLRHGAGDDLPGPDRRAQLVADVVQSADRPDVHPVHVRQLVHLHGEPEYVRLQGRRTQHGHRPWQRAGTAGGRRRAPGHDAGCDASRAVRAADGSDRTMDIAAGC